MPVAQAEASPGGPPSTPFQTLAAGFLGRLVQVINSGRDEDSYASWELAPIAPFMLSSFKSGPWRQYISCPKDPVPLGPLVVIPRPTS